MIENCRERSFIPRIQLLIFAFRKWKLGFHRTQNGSFIPPEITGIYFTFIAKIPGDTLPTKMPAELPSTEQSQQIFTETSRLVPLRLL